MEQDFGSSQAVPSRRERNKLATRRAIAIAALDLLAEVGYDSITVDLVAEKAGISRRTFFNYFPSINDALHDHVDQIFEQAAQVVAEQSTHLPIMDATVVALEEILSGDKLAKVAYLAIQSKTIPSLRGTGLVLWADCIERMAPLLLAASPQRDPFTVSVFVQAILGACNAAFDSWAKEAQLPVTEADLTLLGQRLTKAMELVRDGFPQLHAGSAADSGKAL